MSVRDGEGLLVGEESDAHQCDNSVVLEVEVEEVERPVQERNTVELDAVERATMVRETVEQETVEQYAMEITSISNNEHHEWIKVRNFIKLKKAVILNDVHGTKQFLQLFSRDDLDLSEIIFEAVNKGHHEVLQLLVDSIDDNVLHATNKDGKTALHFAVSKKDLNCSCVLMSRCSSLRQRDKSGNTPLHYMARDNFIRGCEEAMKVPDPSFIREANQRGETALHVAASKHNANAILELLLQHGARVDCKTVRGQYTPLHVAFQHGFMSSAEVLIEHVEPSMRAAYINAKAKFGSTALMLAAKSGFIECIRLLEGTECDLNHQDKDGNTALHYAATKGSRSVVKYLIEKGADSSLLNKKGQTALYLATSAGSEQTMNYLLDNTTLIDDPEVILHVATKKKSLGCIENLLLRPEFLSAIDSQNSRGDTCLHVAVRDHSHEIANALLTCNPSANKEIANHMNEYPIHLAARYSKGDTLASQKRRDELCLTLVRKSFDIIDKSNINNETPLHLSARSGNVLVVRALVKRGCRVLAINSEGYTAFQIAARAGNEEVLDVLVGAVKNTEKREFLEQKPQPLHLAAQYGHLACCKTIVKHLHKMKRKISQNACGLFPVDVAHKHKRWPVFEFLLSAMPRTEYEEQFAIRLHKYAEQAIADNVKQVLEAIVYSDWCPLAFDGYYCARVRCVDSPRPCEAFASLTRQHSRLACAVMDRMISTPDPQQPIKEIHDFTLFETLYYNRTAGDRLMPPFTPDRSLAPSAQQFEGTSWSMNHPLKGAVKSKHMDVLQHRLTRSWLKHRRNLYSWYLLAALVVVDFLTALFVTLTVQQVRENNLMGRNISSVCTNISCQLSDDNVICQDVLTSFNCSGVNIMPSTNNSIFNSSNTMMSSISGCDAGSLQWLCSKCASDKLWDKRFMMIPVTLTIALCFCISFVLIVNILIKVNRKLYDGSSILSFFRLVCLFAILLPLSTCDLKLGLRKEWQWQAGVICMLQSWLHLVGSINRLPACTIFIPFSFKFILYFLKIVLPITIIIFAFSSAFHALLMEQRVFHSLSSSFIQTLVWLKGEFNYEEVFVMRMPEYVVMSTILFVVYVTTIAGLVYSIYAMHSEDQFQSHKAFTQFHQAETSLRIQLLLDDCWPYLRRRYTKSKIEIENNGLDAEKQEYQHNKRDSNAPDTRTTCGTDNTRRSSTSTEEEKSVVGDKLDRLMEEITALREEMTHLHNNAKRQGSK